jgi:Ni/Fe-hydrogenase subunit HybB-like protein
MNQKIIADLLPGRFGAAGKVWVWTLVLICLAGLYAYTRQLSQGLSVTGMRDYASWGIYISNFVFFVAVSLVGSLITAILQLCGVKWSTPLTRISEIIALSAIVLASVTIVVDMGRPDRFVNLFLYGRLQSPIVWDVIVITTYMVLGVLLLYISLLPDLKVMIDHQPESDTFIRRIALVLGGFWKGTDEQIRVRERALKVLLITIIPVALAIHTVTSWLFATTYRSGWDSTNFGAYFVSGAFYAGAGAIVIAMYVLRRAYHLEAYIKQIHFDRMGKMLVLLALLYLYFNINEYLTPAFKMKKAEADHLTSLLQGEFAYMFWAVLLAGIIVPVLIMVFRTGRNPLPMFIAGLMIVTGAWFKRFLIVTPTLLHPFFPMADVPEAYRHYTPTWEEWTITGATLAGALLLITLLVRIFPVIPVVETLQEASEEKEVAPEKEAAIY